MSVALEKRWPYGVIHVSDEVDYDVALNKACGAFGIVLAEVALTSVAVLPIEWGRSLRFRW